MLKTIYYQLLARFLVFFLGIFFGLVGLISPMVALKAMKGAIEKSKI